MAIHPEYLFDFNEDNSIRAKELWVTQQWTRPYYHNSKRKSKLKLLTSEEEALASLIKQKSIEVEKLKIEVNGKKAHPIYKFLRANSTLNVY